MLTLCSLYARFMLILKPCLLFHSPVNYSKLLQTHFNVNLAYSKRVSKFTSKIELSARILCEVEKALHQRYQSVTEVLQIFSTPLKILQFCSIFQNSFSIVFFRAFKIILII